MAELLEYLNRVVKDEGSDLFIIAGSPVCEKLGVRMRPIGDERVTPEESKRLITAIYAQANRPIGGFQARGDDDFSFSVAGLARFRVNAYRQRGSMAAVILVVAFGVPDWKVVGIPSRVIELAEERS